MVSDCENLNLNASKAGPASFVFKQKKKKSQKTKSKKTPNQQKPTLRSVRVWTFSAARPHDCSASPSSTPSLGFFLPPYPAGSLEQRGQCRATAPRSCQEQQEQQGRGGQALPETGEPRGAGKGGGAAPRGAAPGAGRGGGAAAAGRGSAGEGGGCSPCRWKTRGNNSPGGCPPGESAGRSGTAGAHQLSVMQ